VFKGGYGRGWGRKVPPRDDPSPILIGREKCRKSITVAKL